MSPPHESGHFLGVQYRYKSLLDVSPHQHRWVQQGLTVATTSMDEKAVSIQQGVAAATTGVDENAVRIQQGVALATSGVDEKFG